MKKVYICSPYSGDVEKNTDNAREYCRLAIKEGHIPICPHLYFPQFMNDDVPEEREQAMLICEQLVCECDAVWVFGDVVSSGMKREIECASKFDEWQIPIIFKE